MHDEHSVSIIGGAECGMSRVKGDGLLWRIETR